MSRRPRGQKGKRCICTRDCQRRLTARVCSCLGLSRLDRMLLDAAHASPRPHMPPACVPSAHTRHVRSCRSRMRPSRSRTRRPRPGAGTIEISHERGRTWRACRDALDVHAFVHVQLGLARPRACGAAQLVSIRARRAQKLRMRGLLAFGSNATTPTDLRASVRCDAARARTRPIDFVPTGSGTAHAHASPPGLH